MDLQPFLLDEIQVCSQKGRDDGEREIKGGACRLSTSNTNPKIGNREKKACQDFERPRRYHHIHSIDGDGYWHGENPKLK